ncbi:MAG: Gp138 family membrane-puncturing spike protein [Gallionella sp.]|nr:Gp138 family membrane-puncturing spike protein [Gallionella sp.]MDD4958380.1 Gp138 family membrane-puncturing spike protein [Gallionella sp.]
MDPRERYYDQAEMVRLGQAAHQARIWTSFPGIVKSFNPSALTCVVQPAIQGINRNSKGNTVFVDLPTLVDCPILLPGGGGMVMTVPIAAGDEVLVFIASRCIDAWWQNGGVQPPMDIRMHDLSDGFVFPEVFSQPRVFSGYNLSAVEIRSLSGATKISVDGVAETVSILAANGVSITGTVTVVGDVVANGVSLTHHLHSGVQAGSSNSGPPVAGT